MSHQICVSCSERSIGNCEDCNAPVCALHGTTIRKGTRVCRDAAACAEREVKNFVVEWRLNSNT